MMKWNFIQAEHVREDLNEGVGREPSKHLGKKQSRWME